MIPIFHIQKEKDNLVFRCLQKLIVIRMSITDIKKENTNDGIIDITGCVNTAFYMIYNNKSMNISNEIFKEIIKNDETSIRERLMQIFSK